MTRPNVMKTDLKKLYALSMLCESARLYLGADEDASPQELAVRLEAHADALDTGEAHP